MRPSLCAPSLAAAAILLLTAACATTGPEIRTQTNPSANFGTYETFGFPDELGTDRGGYSTIVGEHFKDATLREMTALGYEFSEEAPDLLVNFFTNVQEKTDIRTRTPPPTIYPYYGYRHGLYTVWPAYQTDIRTVNYKVGTVTIDVVDAERKQLVWEAMAEGRLKEETLANPEPAIDRIVAELFSRFPGAPAE